MIMIVVVVVVVVVNVSNEMKNFTTIIRNDVDKKKIYVLNQHST